MEDVPYIEGLDRWIGTELNEEACTYLKDFGAATASNGAVGLYHVDNLTPEAKECGKALVKENANVYVIDDEELKRVKTELSDRLETAERETETLFCRLSAYESSAVERLDRQGGSRTSKIRQQKVVIPTVFTAAPGVLKEFEQTDYARRLKATGVITSYICPLMYMNNPLCAKMPVVTSSNKLRTYTTARYFTDDEILLLITRGGRRS